MRVPLCALLIVAAGAVQAVELQLPAGARQMITRDTVQDRFFAPIAPFRDGVLPTRMVEGAVDRSAWRIDVAGLTPLQVVMPLRNQLEAAGFTIVLDCAAQICGGYDFRFATEVLPAPNMYINIRNYHVLTALRDGAAVTILASASSGASFVQITQAGMNEGAVTTGGALPALQAEGTGLSVPQQLLQNGFVVLDALEFESGTSELGEGQSPVLADLADVMRLRPQMRIALVGHTDNVGSLAANTALSLSRASAVRRRMIEVYGVDAERLDVEGAGFLAPRTTNLTSEGRESNRRVEAVVLTN